MTNQNIDRVIMSPEHLGVTAGPLPIAAISKNLVETPNRLHRFKKDCWDVLGVLMEANGPHRLEQALAAFEDDEGRHYGTNAIETLLLAEIALQVVGQVASWWKGTGYTIHIQAAAFDFAQDLPELLLAFDEDLDLTWIEMSDHTFLQSVEHLSRIRSQADDWPGFYSTNERTH